MPHGSTGTALPHHDELLVVNESPLCAETPPSRLAHPITPAAVHYVRGNFDMPSLAADHAIEVDGLVGAPFRLTVRELRELPSTQVTFTMECAGNDRTKMRPMPAGEPWNTGAVSTARWTGVPLKTLLERAGVLPGAIEVVVEGADSGHKPDATERLSYGRSLPLEALGSDVLLAYEMNDAELPALHGGPVRLVVPGWYGMASVKWVTRISVVDTAFRGYFQAQRYVFQYPDAVVPVTRTRVKSIVVSPSADAVIAPGAEVLVWGWAWSGEGEVTKVEVSSQGGSAAEWITAKLDAPIAAHAWRRWECRMRFERSGEHVLRTRATDSRGNVQPEEIRWNRLGYGNNAVREVSVRVV